MKGIKNIIFDLGAVIFDIDHSLTVQAFADLGLSQFHQNFGHLAQHNLFDEFEIGAIRPEQFRSKLNSIFNVNFSDEEIDTAWNSLLIGIKKENLELLSKLKSTYNSILLSNNNQIHFNWINNYLKSSYGISNTMENYFIKEYYSHQIGMRKPNVEIFEFVLKEHKFNPQETLFIDDTPQHIKSANSLGIQTYLMPKGMEFSDMIKTLNL